MTTADTTAQWMSLGGWGRGLEVRPVVQLLDNEAHPGLWGPAERVWGFPLLQSQLLTAEPTALAHPSLTWSSLSLSLSLTCTSSRTLMHAHRLLSFTLQLSLPLSRSLHRSSFLSAAALHLRLCAFCSSSQGLSSVNRAGIGSVTAWAHTTHSRRCNDSKALRTKAG